ncbi:phospho-N-acetylmuramoyl-pentapeptide-transferase [Neosynechococcus sphagnicola]|uniref:phospho-N-acetylmuramoyl-pentapeptide- transferase n=1 Tax=Neosynechococcus sphagnicola TaxID=1501145 RepID=UPI000A73F43A
MLTYPVVSPSPVPICCCCSGGGLGATALILDHLWGHPPPLSLTFPLVTSALVTAGVGYWVVPLLRALKAGQVIREDGPQAHLQKAGTPTMGGLFFVPVAVAIALIWAGLTLGITSSDFVYVIATATLTLAYSFIGWLDDWQILRRRSNKGISPRMKLALQIGFSALFCLWLAWSQPQLSTMSFPWGLALPLGLFFWPLAWFVPVAESNATNLTDGLDGLAAGTGAIALLGLGALIAPAFPGLMLLCASLSGGYLGFLVHNRHPARVFMGDTGSLALGGALAAIALLSNTLWALLLLSTLFLLETLSVIAQVSYYKATKGPDGVGKRLLKMAPFHHHLELSGWKETQVVGVFYLVNGLLALLCLVLP